MSHSNHQPPTARSVAAILPAGGRGQRFGSERNKLFTLLSGHPVWYHAARRLAARPEIGRLIMPVSTTDRPIFESEFSQLVAELDVELVPGGRERTDSVRAGLDAIGGDASVRMVAVHDAARPLIRDADLAAVVERANETGAAILATPVPGTVKRVNQSPSGQIGGAATVDRRDLWIALTPQVFRLDLLREAYARYRGRPATDDAELVERMGHPVAIVSGSADNLKLTRPEDLKVAEAILKTLA